jgi:hypothetical protein
MLDPVKILCVIPYYTLLLAYFIAICTQIAHFLHENCKPISNYARANWKINAQFQNNTTGRHCSDSFHHKMENSNEYKIAACLTNCCSRKTNYTFELFCCLI